MKLEILLSCMHQKDMSLVAQSRITGDVLMINQCDREGCSEAPTQQGRAIMLSTCERGLTRSRNMAIRSSTADICLLSDDDEVFVPGYEERILEAYAQLPQADVIILKAVNRPKSFEDRVQRLRFPQTMKVSSWQISFKRESLNRTGIRFDELLGSGTGNGAEEELKFLLDCQRAGLEIWYVPVEIASVAQQKSQWFQGYDRQFFYNRGATTRYILGAVPALAYGVYYVARKRSLYRGQLTPLQALGAILRGIMENKITKQAKR